MDTLRIDICYRPMRVGWAVGRGDFDSLRRIIHEISPDEDDRWKLLILKSFWSGRRGSNPRRPAWESERR
jgi:hypothetical protein